MLDAILIVNQILSNEYNVNFDINGDGQLNILDIVRVVNYILGIAEFTDMQFYLADMNQNGEIEILDLVILANAILGQD